ncbi:ankyrin repeat domain-containing protein, partial [candidate division KSB1 bacterium]|nr:ankyrin repeat domain-containing protein [candidate division KSB1 bacterium]
MKMLSALCVLVLLISVAPCWSQDIVQMAQKNDLNGLKQLITEKPESVHHKDRFGRLPIHIAANGGFLEMVDYLLSHDADAGSKTLANTTPLHYAALNGHVAVVQCLLEAGAELEAKNNQAVTPFYYAAMNGHMEVMALLLEKGADINHADFEDGTPIHAAAQKGNLSAVRFLADKGANVDKIDCNGLSALHFACQSGNDSLVQFMLENNLRLNLQDKFGKTPLFYALEQGHCRTALSLIAQAGEIALYAANDGSSYLHAAVTGRCKEVVPALISAGLPVDNPNAFNLTAMDYIAADKDSSIFAFLKNISDRGISAPSIKTGPYFGETPPGDEPALFAPGFISTPFANERDIQWTADGATLYFTRWNAGDWDV